MNSTSECDNEDVSASALKHSCATSLNHNISLLPPPTTLTEHRKFHFDVARSFFLLLLASALNENDEQGGGEEKRKDDEGTKKSCFVRQRNPLIFVLSPR